MTIEPALADADSTVARSSRPALAPLPLRRLLQLALVGSVLVLTLVLVDVARYGGNPVSLVQPGAEGPSAEVFARDFPETELPDGLGHDGQQFYADRPPADARRRGGAGPGPSPLPAAAAAPPVAGVGRCTRPAAASVSSTRSCWSGFGALVVGGASLGAISVTLGGRTWPALVFPLLPGGYVCLRISVADTLSVALALLAIALALRSRWRTAILAAVLAVLAKEVAVILLLGFAVWRRDRRSAALVGVPLARRCGVVGRRCTCCCPTVGDGSTRSWPPFAGLARQRTDLARGRRPARARPRWSPRSCVARGRARPAGLVAPLRAGRRPPARLRLRARRQRDRPQPQRTPRHPRAGDDGRPPASPFRTGVPPSSHTRPVALNDDGGPAGDPGRPGAQPPQHLARPAP